MLHPLFPTLPKEIVMPKWTLTARSRTGAKVNQITGADSDSVAVYSKADLDRRIKAAKSDPRNLTVTVKKEN